MNEIELMKSIAKVAGKIQILGIGLLVLGGLSVWAPQISGMTVSVIVGVLLILGGVIRIAVSWVAVAWGSLFTRVLVGIVTVIAGGYMVANPDQGSQALATVLVFYLFADGISSLIMALRVPPAAGGIWLMLGSLASILLGVLMWMKWPIAGELAIGVLIGIKLILDGVSLIGVGAVAKAAVS